jgi:hypothetical protein
MKYSFSYAKSQIHSSVKIQEVVPIPTSTKSGNVLKDSIGNPGKTADFTLSSTMAGTYDLFLPAESISFFADIRLERKASVRIRK